MTKSQARKKRLEYNREYDANVRKNREKAYNMLKRCNAKPSKPVRDKIASMLPNFEMKRVMKVAKNKFSA